jgi:hypothetical protein
VTTRYEFISATGASLELWDRDVVLQETDERLPVGQLGLTIAGDEVTVIAGTREELRALADRIAAIVELDPETVDEEDA